MDSRKFRNALGQFPTGVVVATARTPAGELIGMTMSSFNSVSLDPPLILFSVHRQTHELCGLAVDFALRHQRAERGSGAGVQPVRARRRQQMGRHLRAHRRQRRADASERRGGVRMCEPCAVRRRRPRDLRRPGRGHARTRLHPRPAARILRGPLPSARQRGNAHAPPPEVELLHGW